MSYFHKDSSHSKQFGGKAKNLHVLSNLGYQVPNWIAINPDLLLEQLDLNQSEEEIIAQLNGVYVTEDILEHIEEHFGEDFQSKTYAVRSSALDEDSKDASFAGQFETLLHVKPQDIKYAILSVWKSVGSDNVLTYRKNKKLSPNWSISVIIQEMVHADKAGVGFSRNPMQVDKDQHLINAVYGLGEGLVSGELNADSFVVSAGNIDSTLAKKEFTMRAKADGSGIEKLIIQKEDVHQACLSKEEILQVSKCLGDLENHFKLPQDVEFAFKDDEFYLLQARPITNIRKKEEGEYTLWDNSNIVESYPGITSPLTYSFILKMYDRVYRQFVGLMGVKDEEIEQHADVFANTLGLVRGRVYYNLLNWYKMLAMLPGYSINASYMENMMGVKERFELKEDYQMSKGLAKRRIAAMLLKLLKLNAGLTKGRKEFLQQLNAVMQEYKAYKFNEMQLDEILKLYGKYEQDLLLKWKAPLINDFFAMIWFGMLQKKCKKLVPDLPNIHNDLLCGSADIISVEPIHRSIAIAKEIAKNPQAKRSAENKTEFEFWEEIKADKFPMLLSLIQDYLEDFGERCVGELKLETISYSDEPQRFIKLIQSYIKQGIHEKQASSNLEQDLRSKAEEKIFEQLPKYGAKKTWFKYLVRKTREVVSNRENLRYERTRAFGMVRRMFSAIGLKLAESGHLKNARDVFYLELQEIKNLASIDKSSLKTLVEAREKEFDQYRKQEVPVNRFFTYGSNFSDRYIYSKEKLEEIKGDLSGIGCCPGIVQAKVQLVNSPEEIDSLNGDILVTTSTDPGWVTLFPTASGIIVERGSLLSHSAIVSREMGIPCIVSVEGLMRSLKSGTEVIMDGSSGEIKLLDNA